MEQTNISISPRDWKAILIIGAAVGLLSQLVISNIVASAGGMLRIAAFLVFLIGAPLALFVFSLLARVVPVFYQIAKFASVGVLNTFVNLGVLNLLLIVTGYAASASASEVGNIYIVFVSLAFIAAGINSFFWNKYWTFKANAPGGVAEAVKFWIVTLLAFVVNVIISSVIFLKVAAPSGVSVGQWSNIGNALGIIFALVVNFLGYKFFVFKPAANNS